MQSPCLRTDGEEMTHLDYDRPVWNVKIIQGRSHETLDVHVFTECNDQKNLIPCKPEEDRIV